MINNLVKAGAKVIAYDVQFTEEGPIPESDLALADAVEGANGKIVLATTEVRSDGSTEIFGGGEGLTSTKAVPAYSGFPQDADSKVRHLQRDQYGLMSFDIAAARLYTGRDIKAPRVSELDRLPRPAGHASRCSASSTSRRTASIRMTFAARS